VRTRGVRYRADTGFEMFCPDCERSGRGPQFWPLTTEFWDVNHGFARCRACWAKKKRQDEKARRLKDPAYIRARNRAYWQENRVVLNLKRKARRDSKKGTNAPDMRALPQGDQAEVGAPVR
jgi:hypothetical protein